MHVPSFGIELNGVGLRIHERARYEGDQLAGVGLQMPANRLAVQIIISVTQTSIGYLPLRLEDYGSCIDNERDVAPVAHALHDVHKMLSIDAVSFPHRGNVSDHIDYPHIGAFCDVFQR